MKLGLPIVWSDRHRLHEPGGEVWIGVRTPGTEVPRRAEAIRDALRACDAWARPGYFAYDTMTLIGPGTYEAARAAVDAALTAADLVAEGTTEAAYALTRPPGHHVTRTAYGGSCYLNSTAASAAKLATSTNGPVTVIDIDAHHGNGTKTIFTSARTC